MCVNKFILFWIKEKYRNKQFFRGSRTSEKQSQSTGSYIGNIETGTSLPSYVAKTKDTIRTNHVVGVSVLFVLGETCRKWYWFN